MQVNRNRRQSRAFWLSAANFYVMAVAVAIAVFFLALWLFRDGTADQPWIPAGIAASSVLVAAVILRRLIIRKEQMRIAAVRRLEQTWMPVRHNVPVPERKLTIERNAEILNDLKRKSDAAMVLERYSDGHREVIQLCSQYLEVNNQEMRSINPGSPRIAALRRGREVAQGFHRQHMLKWAEIEARTLLELAQVRTKISEKVEAAGRALSAVNTALRSYPRERKLNESSMAISEFITKIQVTDLVDRAARASDRGNTKQAKRFYKNALKQLGTGLSADHDRALAAEKIQIELERLEKSN